MEEVHRSGKLLRTYDYDGYGNRIRLIEKANSRSPDRTTDYTYNALNQLVNSTDYHEDRQSYIYDKRGNLREAYHNHELVHQYGYGIFNRLESVFDYKKQIGARYEYNGLGQRIGQRIGAATSPFKPPQLGSEVTSLGEISLNLVSEIEDILDITKPHGNLLQRRKNQEVISFIWDDQLLFAESLEIGVQHYFHDERNSPIRICGDSGFETGIYRYDEFGEKVLLALELQEDIDQPFTFTGYQHCEITGNMYAKAREYSPVQGRFLSQDKYWNPENRIYGDERALTEVPQWLFNALPDPLAVKQSGNSYSYTASNPLGYIDPTGLTCENCDGTEDNSGIPIWTIDSAKTHLSNAKDLISAGKITLEHYALRRLLRLMDGAPGNAARGQRVANFRNTWKGPLVAGGVILGVAGFLLEFYIRYQDKDTSTTEAFWMAAGVTIARSAGFLVGAAIFAPVLPPVGSIVGGMFFAYGFGIMFEQAVDEIRNPAPRSEVNWRVESESVPSYRR